ncbi:MAG: hypothetical protein IKO27_04595 [Ruminococcus sp.]|nr:hypothetical protein [Ruminococcus sp.]
MFGTDANFYKNRVLIEGAGQYKTNEILTAFLECDLPDLRELLESCKSFERKLHYPETFDEVARFDGLVQRAITFFSSLDEMIDQLPPYRDMKRKHNFLFELMNEYRFFFDNEPDIDHCDHHPRPEYNDHFYTDLTFSDLDPDMCDGALQLNQKLRELAEQYRAFIEDCIRVKTVYAAFLEKVHQGKEYLNTKETAEIYLAFVSEQKDRLRTYDKLEPSGTMSEIFVPQDIDGELVLCEKYKFSTLGGFLYIDLFKGLNNHFLPRKCGLCGRYFLLEATAYSPFCTRPTEDRKDKTCRDLGHRRTYADKVNSDPVLLVYTKAYKQHYARYLKKKMSQNEFRLWADYALELRQRAYDKELNFEEYAEEIRK